MKNIYYAFLLFFGFIDFALAQNGNLVKIYHNSTDAEWNPEPAELISVNEEVQTTLETEEEETSFLGIVSYGIAEHCNDDLICDPNFQFHVYVNNQYCTVDKKEMSNGVGLKYLINHTSDFEDYKVICNIDIVAEEITDPPLYGFTMLQALPTEGLRHWEFFSIDSKNYLLADNSAALVDDGFSGTNLFIFDMDAFKFEFDDRLILNECNASGQGWLFMDHVYWWKHFQIDNQHGIIMANNNVLGRDRQSYCTDETSYITQSNILWWDGEQFDDKCGMNCDHVITDSPMMIESYTVGVDNYLAIAEMGKGEQSGSSIYKWNAGSFEKTDQPHLQLNHADYIESFKDNQNNTFLIFNRNAENEETVIYQVDVKGQLHLYQSSTISPAYPLAPQGHVKSSLVFKSTDNANNAQLYLLLASDADVPWIYRWEFDTQLQRSLFKPYQQLSTDFNNTFMFAQYVVNDQRYIAAAQGTKGAYGYLWNSGKQILEQTPAHVIYNAGNLNIQALTPFSVTDKSGNTHLLIALAAYDLEGQTAIESPIMQWATVRREKPMGSPGSSEVNFLQ